MFRSSWSKEVSVVSRSMVVIVSPVDLELFKRAEGDPRESVAELSKLGIHHCGMKIIIRRKVGI